MTKTTQSILNKPKIEINLTGLGVICFNEDHRAEVGYLEIEDHETIITITKNKKEIMSGKMESNLIINPNSSNGCEVYQIQTEDNRNFDNMLDLNEAGFYPNAEFGTNGFTFDPLIYLNDCVFSTEEDSFAEVIKVNDSDLSQPIGDPLCLGSTLVGQTKNDDASFTYCDETIEVGEGENYVIQITSNCKGDRNDFKHHFDYLNNDRGLIKYNLLKSDDKLTNISENAYIAFQLIVSELFNISKESYEKFNMEDVQLDIRKDLDTLSALLCTPKPCLFVTFTNKHRSIPK